jgi:hypothetical protein
MRGGVPVAIFGEPNELGARAREDDNMRPMRFSGLLFFAILLFADSLMAIDAEQVVYNLEKNEKQSVLQGRVDAWAIKRGNAEFSLGPGEATLFDFESGRIAAIVFTGRGTLRYAPPNDIEAYQIRRFTKNDTLDEEFDRIVFYFTVELDDFPDTSGFARTAVDKKAWELLREADHEKLDKLGDNVGNRMMGDLLAGGPGTYLCAYIFPKNGPQMIFVENPLSDDLYRLYRNHRNTVSRSLDVLSGYSPDGDLPSQRGVMAIDIKNYDIRSRIESGGRMMVDCTVRYTPLRWGRQFFFLWWYGENKPLSVIDSHGDSLYFINRKDEPGLGIVLNEPMEIGREDSVLIRYQCKSLENRWGVYYMSITGQSFWYPWNEVRDVATYDLTYNCIEDYQVISCGDSIEAHREGNRLISRWRIADPVGFASFNIGSFDTKAIEAEGVPPVRVYMSHGIPHDKIEQMLAYYGDLSGGDMIGRVGADVTNALSFYTSLFGPCPFNAIKVTEIPMSHGQGPPGLIHLSWGTFQQESSAGSDEQFRAHEVAHQWWGNQVSNESYRDTWIIEGLAEYCGFWFYQMSSKDNKSNCDRTLENWRERLISGVGVVSEGSKAGPVVMGGRLTSTKSADYSLVVYEKGAYIFHMIRYLLHDYKTGSDSAFAAFLKDLAVKYKGKIITTEGMRSLLEKHVGGDMGWFFDQWVYGTAIPKYTFGYDNAPTADGKFQVRCHVKQEGVPDNFAMMVPLTVTFEDERYIHLRILVDQPEADIDLPTLPLKPKKIVFNTYGAVLCDVKYE